MFTLADNLRAFFRGDDDEAADAGGLEVATVLSLIRQALTQKG